MGVEEHLALPTQVQEEVRLEVQVLHWQLAMFPVRPPLRYRMMEIIIVSRSLSDLKKSIFQ